ncbi:MAG: RNA polymerase sigma factor, partial [Acidimicrobiia bacterium]
VLQAEQLSRPSADAVGPSDEEQARRPDLGDRRWLAEIFRRYESRLWSCAHRMVLPGEVEDAYQEIALRILDGLPRFRGDSSLSTWIFSVARHTCLDVRRRRRGTAAQLEEQVPSSEATGAGEHSFDLSVAACRTALALRELPDSQQAVVLLRLGWGLSTQQTAERLGISRDAVKARLRRARVALRDSLEEALSCPACGPGSYRVTPEGIV